MDHIEHFIFDILFSTAFHISHFVLNSISHFTFCSQQHFTFHILFSTAFHISHFVLNSISHFTFCSQQHFTFHILFSTAFHISHFVLNSISHFTFCSQQHFTFHILFSVLVLASISKSLSLERQAASGSLYSQNTNFLSDPPIVLSKVRSLGIGTVFYSN